MTLEQLIARFRTDANDKAQPYFWTGEEVTAWLNDAVEEACIRGRLIHEYQDAEICRITAPVGVANHTIHAALYELTSIEFQVDGETTRNPLYLASTGEVERLMRDWTNRPNGRPHYAVQSDTGLRLVPAPDVQGVVLLEGYRLPVKLLESDSDEPEINAVHHRHLINWVLHRAFSIPDTEGFDPERASRAEGAFTQYFGIRPDADLRRTTREDVPHTVKGWWV